MNTFKKHWRLLLVALVTGVLGVVVFLTTQKLKTEAPVAPTVPQEEPAALSPACTLTFQIEIEPTAVDCTAGPSDTFDDSSLDTTKWTTAQVSQNATIEVTNGALRVVQPAEGAKRRVDVESNNIILGDFVVEVDIPNVNSQEKNKGVGELLVASKGNPGTGVVVQRTSTAQKDIIISTNKTEDGEEDPERATIPRSANLRVKVERVGNTIKTYYKMQNDYQLLATYTNGFTNEARIILRTKSVKAQFPRTMAQYDNFAVTCPSQATPTPTPTGTPSPTPTPTDTSAPTPTPTSIPDATPTPTTTSSVVNTSTPNPTTEPITLASPAPTTATPQVPVAGTGPSILGATVIAAGMLLLLLGFVF